MKSKQHKTHGLLITFEGGDGSGKGTQSSMLRDYLENIGLPVLKGGFPMYETPTGKKVADYLNGKLGPNVGADEAGQLYQNDRVANIGPIIEFLENGGIVDLDRYIDSNSGHQGGKISTREGRIEYIKKNTHAEHVENGLPLPDLTILFTLAPNLSQEYVKRKVARTYTEKSHDIHEADPDHLRNANESFLLLAELYPERVRHIDVTDPNGLGMLSKEAIHQKVIKVVQPLLKERGFIITA